MRVFDIYEYNIVEHAKFKDTKNYLDKMLEGLGLQYQEVSFSFSVYDEDMYNKILGKFPNLKKYQFIYESCGSRVFTSFTPNWYDGEIYVAPEDRESIFAIMAKVPRSFNLTPKVVLDKIDWYGDGVQEAILQGCDETIGKPQTYSYAHMLNSQIIMERVYNDGNKRNNIKVIVEATTKGMPRDTTDIAKRLESYLGKAEYHFRTCRFDEKENLQLKEFASMCRAKLGDMIEEFYPKKRPDYRHDKEFIPNLANKKKIMAAFKGTDFKVGSNPGMPQTNRMICIDKHNHYFEILFDRTQGSPDYFYYYIEIQGHNFRISSGQNIMLASSEEEAEQRLNEIATFSMKVKEELGAVIAEKFGDTPDWYTYIRC